MLPLLAMKVYPYWYGRYLEPVPWLFLLALGSAAFFVLGLWRSFRQRRAYKSPTFFLAFCPGLCCWLAATYRAHEYDWRYVDNADVMLADIVQARWASLWITVGAVLVYTAIYLVRRRFVLGPPVPTEA